MSSWDTNPWSNFCDPQWELICRNKWHPEISEISTTPEIAVGTHFHARRGTKTTPVFLPADRESSWSLLPSSVSLLSSGTVEPENTHYCILKVTGQVWESWSIFIVTPSLEERSTKAKDTPPHEVKLTLLGTNPLFQCLGENRYKTQGEAFLLIMNKYRSWDSQIGNKEFIYFLCFFSS